MFSLFGDNLTSANIWLEAKLGCFCVSPMRQIKYSFTGNTPRAKMDGWMVKVKPGFKGLLGTAQKLILNTDF